jgi:hypothetical protein
VCGELFAPLRRPGSAKRYCSRACRQKAFVQRRRDGAAPVPIPVDFPERGLRHVATPTGSREDHPEAARHLRPPPVVLNSGEVIG